VAKRVGVTTIVMQKLEQYKKPEQKYYNLIDIIADPYFLVACYEKIAKKKVTWPPEPTGLHSMVLTGTDLYEQLTW